MAPIRKKEPLVDLLQEAVTSSHVQNRYSARGPMRARSLFISDFSLSNDNTMEVV